ncbi:MAG: RNHCP domain-containing protein [Oscillospiraceae bacterium]|nr:RNHCP domain-containing protein [Oscillospiraceae bacterium]
MNNSVKSDSFICKVCGAHVTDEGAGTKNRNHCPVCLSSIHLDDEVGDRAAECGGIMEPIGVWVRKNGEWAIIHRCKRCGELSSNRIAADDSPVKLMSIAVKPLASPPFPAEYWNRLEQSETDKRSPLPNIGFSDK